MATEKETLFNTGRMAPQASAAQGDPRAAQGEPNQSQQGYGDEQGDAPAVLTAEEQREIEKEATAALQAPVAVQHASTSVATPEWLSFDLDVRFAKAFATSGLFGLRGKSRAPVPIGQATAAAFVRIQVGKSLGFDAAQSMMGISIVQDKPVVEYRILAARCKALGYGWEAYFTHGGTPQRCTGCRLFLLKNGVPMIRTKRDDAGNPIQKKDREGKLVFDQSGDPVYEAEQVSVAFTEADAKRITQETWRDNKKVKVSLWEKDTYQNYGENMFFARAFHNAQRFHMSEAINGAVFVKESMEAEDVVETYESGPGKYSTYGDDPARYGASEALRAIQKDQQANSAVATAGGAHSISASDEKTSSGSAANPEEKKPSGFGKRNA